MTMRNTTRSFLLVVVCFVGAITRVHAWSSSRVGAGIIDCNDRPRIASARASSNPRTTIVRKNVNNPVEITTVTIDGRPVAQRYVTKRGGSQKSWINSLARPLLAEFLGTFIVVQFGVGAGMSAIFGGALAGVFEIAMVTGIAVALATYSTIHTSGAHLNPAFTLIFALYRKFSWKKVIPYTLAQLSGATCAAWVNFVLFSSRIREFEYANKIVRGSMNSIASAKALGEYYTAPIDATTAFCSEAFGAAMLAFIIFSLTNPKNKTMEEKSFFVPPLIGLCVAGLISVVAPISQAGFNPARDVGPRIVAWLAGWKQIAFSKCWVYVVGPLVGAPVGAFLADKVLFAKRNDGSDA